MKGFVPTPPAIVDLMVDRLFRDRPQLLGARLLDPGCGHGVFIEGVLRWCRRNRQRLPEIVGIELDSSKLQQARRLLADEPCVTLVEGDFLTRDLGTFDYVIGNPPYVGIEELTVEERTLYRERFRTARGRLDLYLLFWERALQLLKPRARIVFITPEKYTYVEAARPLRCLLPRFHVEELLYAAEDTFPGLVTYPVITTVTRSGSVGDTLVHLRNGASHAMRLPAGGDSWQPLINRSPVLPGASRLSDVALRVSCGVATGADKVYLFRPEDLPAGCARFSRPAIAGRELRLGHSMPTPRRVLFMPYGAEGRLLSLESLGKAADYLHAAEVRQRLEARSCVERKPWYAFHETPPLGEMLRPKLICKDIGQEPHFWVDEVGDLVPLHSTYYIVPAQQSQLHPLAEFLNSHDAKSWLRANCQRAANGFVRTQSAVLKQLPIPDAFLRTPYQQRLAA
jgi:adenine-specific DNA-methyltransferase